MHLMVGGAGFLGVQLARFILGLGGTVRIFDRRRHARLPEGAETVLGDVLDVHALCTAARGASGVFHLAAAPPRAHAARELMHGVNVGGTANVIRAALEAGVRRVVFLSTAEVYGYPLRIPIREDDAKVPVTDYGRTKWEAELRCLQAWRQYGLETVILRPSVLVGPGLTDRFLLLLLASMVRDQPIAYVGSGRNRFQFTALDDCVSACWQAMTMDGNGGQAFNVGSADPLPFLVQAEQVRARTGCRSPLWRMPQEPAATVLRWLGRLHLLPLQPERIPALYRDFVMDITKARGRLHWEPRVGNVDMLVEAYEWYVKRRGAAGRAGSARDARW